MFFSVRKENLKLKEKVKSQALENTSLLRENEQLRWKLKKIQKSIKDFDHIHGNAFTLINSIDNEIKIGFWTIKNYLTEPPRIN